MNPPKHAEVGACHDCYCRFMDFAMPLNAHVTERWERWLHEGFTLENLQLVLKYWSFQTMRGVSHGVLRFSRITDPAVFVEDLCLAHAARKARQGPREKAMEQLRPTAIEPRNNGVDTTTARQAMVNGLAQVRKAIEGN